MTSIRFVLKKNRRRKDGEYPVYLVVCHNGRVEKAIGVSVLERNWDAKRESVKGGANSAVLNKMLNDIKKKVVDKKIELEIMNTPYTAGTLVRALQNQSDDKSIVFAEIAKGMCHSRRLAVNTQKKYKSTITALERFLGYNGFLLTELDLPTCKDFAQWILKNGCGDGTVRDRLSCIAAVWNYAIDRRLVSSELYPFREFKFNEKYQRGTREYFLEKVHIRLLMNYWESLVVNKSGTRWSYKDGAYERLRKRTSEEFSILWFLLCYKFASAPVEIALLKPINCSRTLINSENYMAIDFRRKKTNKEVKIRFKRDMFAIIAIEHFLGSCNGRFVYPVITMDDEYKQLKQSSNVSERCRYWVREAFKKVNEEIIRMKMEEGIEYPLVEVDKVDMYTARHSAASHYFNSSGATIGGLATMLGRSPNKIATYAHLLRRDDELADIASTLEI